MVQQVRSNKVVTAYYGFKDASSGGFGLTVEQPNGLHGRFGLWGRDAEDESSYCQELKNLVEMVEEEAANGHLRDSELWIFMKTQPQRAVSTKAGLHPFCYMN